MLMSPQKDDIMELTISGNPMIPFPLPGVPTLQGENVGNHIIHCLDRGRIALVLLYHVPEYSRLYIVN